MSRSIFLVMPVPFQSFEGKLGFDPQTCRGLQGWADHFDRVIMACPILPRTAQIDQTTVPWQALETLPCASRVELVPLPYAYRVPEFLGTYWATRKLIAQKIQDADYLCFAFGALIGEWGGVAIDEAQRQGRPYSVWIDRVEYEVAARTLGAEPLRRQLWHRIILPPTKWFHHHWVRNATLGLFQGQDCYSTYAPLSQEPHCVYDVHTTREDQITPQALQIKLAELERGEPLRIGYMGRAAEMKGPLDWLKVIQRLHQSGIPLQATWLGDGPLLAKMQELVQEWGLTDVVQFPGFVSDHGEILKAMKDLHLFMFCHKTPESPRCLVESLVCGAPIVGYGSAYPEGLVADHGGGVFVAVDDWEALAQEVIVLERDRPRLRALLQAAAQSGQNFSEEEVFQNRADLIKRYLTPPSPSGVEMRFA